VDFEKLDKAHKALKSEFSSLSKSHEQPQIQSTKEPSKEVEVEVLFPLTIVVKMLRKILG
jgi:hypothetical protein